MSPSRGMLMSRHRPAGPPPGGLTFEGQTNWARPTITVVRDIPFTTKAQLDSAIANMAGGDYIHYTGSGVLAINNSGGNAYQISSKNPSSPVIIDFGTSHSVWNPGIVSPNYVAFNYTGSTTNVGVVLDSCSNLILNGGDVASGGYGIQLEGRQHDITWNDVYVHDIAASGFHMRGITGSGASVEVNNIKIRAEVNRFCMNPALDPHGDKGTGLHAFLFHDTNGGIMHDNTIALYAHDSLRPGEVSYGQTWGEGGGGSAIEIGSPSVSETNNTFYIKGVNLLMTPNGTNPGSTGSPQTGGNVFNLWGSIPMNGMVVGWAEGINCTGAVVLGTGGGWHPGSPAISVLHGRHSNVNQYVGSGGNIAIPYDNRWGINYSADCT